MLGWRRKSFGIRSSPGILLGGSICRWSTSRATVAGDVFSTRAAESLRLVSQHRGHQGKDDLVKG